MNKIFFKNLHKKLYCFIALFLVAALGSGLFLSLSTLPDAVETSLYKYLSSSNLMDVKITSTIGFSTADANAVEQMSSVDAVMPVSTVNALLSVGDKFVQSENGTKATAKVSSINIALAQSNDKGNINRLTIKEGRFPERENECLIDADACKLNGIDIGSTITLSGDGEDIFSSLSLDNFKVVGTVDVPTYLTKNLGSENVGSGKLDALIYIDEDVFSTDNFTELYVRLRNLQDYNYSGNKYFEKIQTFSQEVLSLGADRLETRAELVAAIAREQIEKDRTELDAFTKSFEKELDASKKKLDEILEYAVDGDKLLKDKEAEINNSLDENQQKLLEQKTDFLKVSDKYFADLARYNQDRENFSIDREAYANNFAIANENISLQAEKLEKAKAEVEAYERRILLNQQVIDSYTDPSKLPDFEELLANTDTNGLERDFIKYMQRCARDTSDTKQLARLSLSQQQMEYAAKKVEYDEITVLYNQYKKIVDNYETDTAALIKTENELIERKKKLDERKQKIEEENQDILSGENAITNETLRLRLELAELKIKVDDAKKNKETYEKEYNELKTQGEEKIENLTRSLETNEILVNNADVATWSVSDVRSIRGYDVLSSTVSAVSGVSLALAIIAAVLLVVICVLSMLKFVYSQSYDFEKLLAFGLTKASVVKSYLILYIPIYIFATLCGIVFTTYITPVLVKSVLDIQFAIPTIEMPVPILNMVIIAIVLVILVPVLFAIIFTKTNFVPKKNRKKFNLATSLITTALSFVLVLTSGGFLLGNFISAKAGLAKGQGIIYDAIADFSFPTESADKAIFANSPVKESLFAQKFTVTGTVNYDLFVVENAKDFNKFISADALKNDGVIISKQLAKKLAKKKGDTLETKLPDGTSGKIKISEISDNSAQSVMYISKENFEKTFKQTIVYNCAFLNFTKSKLSVTKIGEQIMKNAVVSKVTSTETIDAELSLNNSISNIILIAVCAIGTVWSALCFVSLFTADIRRKKFTIDTL